MCSEVRRHVEVKLHGPREEPETKVKVKLLVNSTMLEKQKLTQQLLSCSNIAMHRKDIPKKQFKLWVITCGQPRILLARAVSSSILGSDYLTSLCY